MASAFTAVGHNECLHSTYKCFYWDVNGTIKFGTVESTSRMMDGTQVLNIKVNGGGIVSLPISSISKIT